MKLTAILKNIFYSFPVQLFILHFRKYQVLLLCWFILFSTVNSGFMKTYGADALFFSPEYLGQVGILGSLITGMALGVFVMSWNITTFIMHSHRFKFLASTTNPFLKYCINNAILPIIFLLFYFIKLYRFNDYRELMSDSEIFVILSGIVLGIILLLVVSFAYFFGADKTIYRSMKPIMSNPELLRLKYNRREKMNHEFGLKVYYYFTARLKLRKPRKVGHYRQDFIDAIFKRHHLAAIASIVLAFIFLIVIALFSDNPFFEMPAAASVLIFLALMIAVIGALTYFLQSWSLPVVILLLILVNILYKNEIIDPRNKAYGINYSNNELRPSYSKQVLQDLAQPAKQEYDRQNMISILNEWKKRQASDKPLMVFINVSGGGLRSATFTMNTLQQLDSASGGTLMQKCFLISGASGGMLAAAYYRELYRKSLVDSTINLLDKVYTDNISGDLLNPIFSSMISRDIFMPVQKFTVGPHRYTKDRGFAFERKLSQNTGNLLNIQLKDVSADEKAAKVPLMFFNAVIKSDGRKLIISTQPVSFMMEPYSLQTDTSASPDAVDFGALFSKQEPLNLRMLSALRMNATFPYVLPNVWLPSRPVIDVMDAGLRDNYGQETTLRFIDNFEDWIKENTSGVLILQIRDRLPGNWNNPYEPDSFTDMMITPVTMLQHSWFKLQDYAQADQYNYFKKNKDSSFSKISITYIPEKEEKGAALNLHLSAREKRDIIESFNRPENMQAMQNIARILRN